MEKTKAMLEPPQRALMASLTLLRAMHETDQLELELGFPPIEVWEKSFDDPRFDDGYRMLEAAHVRFMYSQKKMSEVQDRLYADEKNEWIGELYKTINAWVVERNRLEAWLKSEDGQVEDEESSVARMRFEELDDYLKEIGGKCPFRNPNEVVKVEPVDENLRTQSGVIPAENGHDVDVLPTAAETHSQSEVLNGIVPSYEELDKDTRIRIFSALCRWGSYNSNNGYAALHQQSDDVLAIARCAPLGWDKKGHAYYWFPDVAPYRIFKESYPDPPKKPKELKVEDSKKQHKKTKKEESDGEEDSDEEDQAKKKGKGDDGKNKKAQAKDERKKTTKGSSKSSESSGKQKEVTAKRDTQAPPRKKLKSTATFASPTKKADSTPKRASPFRTAKPSEQSNTSGKKTNKVEESSDEDEDQSEDEVENSASKKSKKIEVQKEEEPMPNFTSSGRVIRKPVSAAEEFAQQKKADLEKQKQQTSAGKKSTTSKDSSSSKSGSSSAKGSKKPTAKAETSSDEDDEEKPAKSKKVNKAASKKQSSSKKKVETSSSSDDEQQVSKSRSASSKKRSSEEPPAKKPKTEPEARKKKAPVNEVVKSKGKVPPREKLSHYSRDVDDLSQPIFWECLCTDWDTVQAFVAKMEAAKENSVLLQGLRHVIKWADVIGKEQVEVFAETQAERLRLIEKHNLQLAYEELERERLADGDHHGSLTFDHRGIHLRRSGRVKKLTEMAQMSKEFEEMEEFEDPKDARPISGRAAKFMVPSTGTRRSSRLARSDENEDEEAEDDNEEDRDQGEEDHGDEKWQCSKCTFQNGLDLTKCAMCGTRQPPQEQLPTKSPTNLLEQSDSKNDNGEVSAGSSEHFPVQSMASPAEETTSIMWGCSWCSQENNEELQACAGCMRPRFAPQSIMPAKPQVAAPVVPQALLPEQPSEVLALNVRPEETNGTHIVDQHSNEPPATAVETTAATEVSIVHLPVETTASGEAGIEQSL